MSVKISRVLHAGYIFECLGTNIIFDPIFENPFSQNCHPFPSVEFNVEEIKKQSFDAVFISHFHDDHFSLESLNYISRKTPVYAFCVFQEMFEMLKELGFENVSSLRLGETISIGSFEVTTWKSLDEDVDSIFQIQAGGVNILNVVDSWIDDDTLEQLQKQNPWDLILWPFQTMREIEVLTPFRYIDSVPELPQEWRLQLQKLNPKYVVPSSCQFQMENWSWYNHAFFPITYIRFEQFINSILPYSQVFRMDPSVSISVSSFGIEKSLPLPWVRMMDDFVVDYDFCPQLKAPDTSQIASKFAELTVDELKSVLEYCQTGIIKKYKTLRNDELYFKKPRTWCLSVFDHQGQKTDFIYVVQNNSLQLCRVPMSKIEWLTEVPVYKLHGALTRGESLTSMYVRINDVEFSSTTEEEIRDVEVLEDPLVRCLFEGQFGSYQKAQLRKLNSKAPPEFQDTPV